MTLRALVPLTVSAALLLSAGQALAEEDPGARLRFGVIVGGGPFIVPGVLTVGAVGGVLQLGVQFNNVLALHAELDVIAAFGKVGGSCPGGALLAELTLGRSIAFGVGPEVVWYDVGERDLSILPRSGYLYGGKLRFAWLFGFLDRDPSFSSSFFRPSWMNLPSEYSVGLDVRLLGGGAGFAGVSNTPGHNLVLAPMVNVGFVTR